MPEKIGNPSLSAPQSDLVPQRIKSPYNFDFLSVLSRVTAYDVNMSDRPWCFFSQLSEISFDRITEIWCRIIRNDNRYHFVTFPLF